MYPKTFVMGIFVRAILGVILTDGAYLGNADGKVYYTGGTGTWTQAHSYCVTTEKMQLPEIRSAAQQEFLMTRFNSSDFTGEYWLGAAHWLHKSQFRWTTDNVTVVDFSPNWDLGVSDTCLSYTASNSNSTNGNWKLSSCTASKKVLCEIVL